MGIHMELLTPYLQAASVVSWSLLFTCAVPIFPRRLCACSVDIPAFSAAWGDKKNMQLCLHLWEQEKRLFLSFSALKLSWEDLCKQQVTYPSQDKLSTFPSVLR